MTAAAQMKLILVCSNNLIRSPYAAAKLQPLAPSGVEVISRGAYAGAEPRPTPASILRAASSRGVDLSHHRTATVTAEELRGAGAVVPMDEDSYEFVCDETAVPARAKIHRFVAFLNDLALREVADPILHGEPVEECLTLIDKGIDQIVKWLPTWQEKIAREGAPPLL